jgi:hypothetical protein
VMPLIENLILSLRGSSVFSKWGLRKGYNQVSIEKLIAESGDNVGTFYPKRISAPEPYISSNDETDQVVDFFQIL